LPVGNSPEGKTEGKSSALTLKISCSVTKSPEVPPWMLMVMFSVV